MLQIIYLYCYVFGYMITRRNGNCKCYSCDHCIEFQELLAIEEAVFISVLHSGINGSWNDSPAHYSW